MKRQYFLIFGVVLTSIFCLVDNKIINEMSYLLFDAGFSIENTSPVSYYLILLIGAALLGILYWRFNGVIWQIIIISFFSILFTHVEGYLRFWSEKTAYNYGEFTYEEYFPEILRVDNYSGYNEFILEYHTLSSYIMSNAIRFTIWGGVPLLMFFVLKRRANIKKSNALLDE